ncbi:hypothetical protein [Acuticoccus sediminis]|uniref:hypothetical protein n=1 Tax=Acuticoccus sediminis TaxID=2184697 RepID=UPI001CFEF9E6|nr:hypothetical protein [Acuticoccus sediminis]
MARPIADVLREMNRGDFYDEVSDELGALVEAVQETGKAGMLTLKISVSPNSDATVKVAGDVSTRLPRRARGDNVFFVAGTGSLQRHDPRQSDIFEPRLATSDDAEPRQARKVKGYDD